MTPSVYGYYFSGDDDDPMDGSETLPLLATDGWWTTPGGWAVGQTTEFFFNDNNYAIANGYPDGLWLIGFALKDISLIENLKSTFAIEYGQGTIDSDLVKKHGTTYLPQHSGVAFTDEDSFVQIALDSQYKIYENLSAVLELGYAHLDMDDSTWGQKDYLDDDAYLATFGFVYNF